MISAGVKSMSHYYRCKFIDGTDCDHKLDFCGGNLNQIRSSFTLIWIRAMRFHQGLFNLDLIVCRLIYAYECLYASKIYFLKNSSVP